MEISQYYLARLAKVKIQVVENKVVVYYKDLFHDQKEELDLKEISPKIINSRSGDPNWSNVGWSLIAIGSISAMLLFFRVFDRSVYLATAIPLLILAVIAFILRTIKNDYVVFRRNTGQIAFSIRLHGKSREIAENMVKYIISHIEQNN
jgi:hypothetical protein